MARPSTGNVIEHVGNDGKTYRSLRFTAYGKRRYVSLGAISAEEAEAQLRHTLSDVEREIWAPPAPPEPVEAPPEPAAVPTFHQYAEQWWTRAKLQLAAKTQTDYRWRLECHLLARRFRRDAVSTQSRSTWSRATSRASSPRGSAYATPRRVGSRCARRSPTAWAGIARGRCSRSRRAAINMTVTLLAAILETAVEREMIVRNPAKGKGRRVREQNARRSYLETAEQIESLLDAAGEMDAHGDARACAPQAPRDPRHDDLRRPSHRGAVLAALARRRPARRMAARSRRPRRTPARAR